jgi:hypothetical protein
MSLDRFEAAVRAPSSIQLLAPTRRWVRRSRPNLLVAYKTRTIR